MDTENNNLTAQQSLDIITSMIRQVKGNISYNSFYFLLWGWTIVIANLGVFIMIRFTDIKNPTMIFMITIISAIISIVYSARKSKTIQTKTVLDSVNMWLWIGYGITCFTIVAFGNKTNWQINPIVITMGSVPTFATGIMLRFKPLVFGGVALWLFGIVLFLLPSDLQFLIAAIAITIGYLVPGYMLKKSDADVS
ncbi:MAG TPA: hypothetical protein VFE50_00510 [Cyclobacteriaceae bacterium]|nr:hypothetical protein [Cyclobacteriaceae bacterium]